MIIKRVIAILFLLTATIQAELYIKQVIKTEAYQRVGGIDVPPNEYSVEQWFNKDQCRINGRFTHILLDVKKNEIKIAFPYFRKYVKAKLPVQYKDIRDKERLEINKRNQYSLDIKSTNLQKKIRNWKCTAYDYTVKSKLSIHAKYRLWVTQDVPFDLIDYQKKMQPHLMKATSSYLLSDHILSELCKIKGFWIRLEMELDKPGLKSTLKDVLEVTEISEKKPPENTFTLPKNYKQTDPIF